MTANATTKHKSLYLKPALDSEIEDFIFEAKTLNSLVSAMGSPLNLMFPGNIRKNLDDFKAVLGELGLRNRIFFAHKCNRADSLVKELALTDASIDVSSPEELKHVLGCGFSADRIQATGPKTREFLTLALLHNIVLSIDSADELEQIIELKERLNCQAKTRILLRLSGFQAEHANFKPKASRFGIPVDKAEDVLETLESRSESFDLLGFAYHIDTVSIPEKALAFENCLEMVEVAYDYGFEPTVINIGGGFKVNYLAEEKDWNEYTSAIKEAVLGERESLTWQNASYGLSARKGVLSGSLNLYNFYDSSTGAQFLKELLNHKLSNQNNASIASIVRENGIELWIEPGRSMISQCGITVGRVTGRKESSLGDTLIMLEMKRQDVSFLDQELFVDPIIVSQSPRKETPDAEPIAVFFAGNLCLESDLITKRKVFLNQLPAPGDLAIFANTAGYFMDFSASHSIMQPIAEKVAVYKEKDEFKWSLDKNYNPLNTLA